MKKYLVWIGAAVLVMALASPSMAQFKSWGHLEIESYWRVNPSFNKDLTNANTQGVGSRYRFNLGYGDPKTVMAVLGFEANARAYGEGPEGRSSATIADNDPATNAGATYPGQASRLSAADSYTMGGWGTDRVALQVRHAYLDFTIPNTPLTMQIGLQNVAIGGFLGRFFMNKDVPGYILNANFAPHTLSAFWWKAYKQSFYVDNDNDYYGLLYRLKQQMFNVEAWFVYNNDRRTQTDGWAWVPTTATSPFLYQLQNTVTPRGYDQQPWWLGANVPITFGNWKFEPTFIYQGGKFQNSFNAATAASADWSAYLADLTVTYRLGPGLSFLAEGFYATGADGTKNNGRVPLNGNTYGQFDFPGGTSFGNENRNVFGNGFSVFYFWNTELSYYSAHQLTPSGHWYGRLNAEFNPMAWLNLNLNYMYIGNAANKYVGHISGAYSSGTPYSGASEKSYIGSELNAIARIAIYKDFIYTIGYGYFFPGDVYDTPTKTADAAWTLLSNLRYVF